MNPPGFPFDANTFSQGMAISPCNPSVLYLTIESFDTRLGGLFRSTNAGASWSRVARVVPNYTGVDFLDNPVRVRVDPNDPLHVYAIGGVRGATQGFWVSTDGGDSFVPSEKFAALNTTAQGMGMFQYDVYDIAVDPTDFKHILLAHHSGWGAKWGFRTG